MKKAMLWPVMLILIAFVFNHADAAPSAADASVPAPATGPANAASGVVQRFLDDRSAGDAQAAYALLTDASKKDMPDTADGRAKAIKSLEDSGSTAPPNLTALGAMFLDFTNAMNYNLSLLGPSANDPKIVLVRTRKVGTPMAEAQILKIATTTDPSTGGVARIDFVMMMAALMDTHDPGGARSRAMEAASASRLKQIGLGIIMYETDHNKLPDADKWVDEIMPYLKDAALFHDPSAPTGQKWSYAYNRNLSAVKLASVKNPAQTVIVFDSTLGTKNASDTGASVPKPGRHEGTSDFAFADGSVRSLPDSLKPLFVLSGAP